MHQPGRLATGELARSDLIFSCDVLQQTGQDLTARGMRFPAPPARMASGCRRPGTPVAPAAG
jgi:hypothetical protein